MSEFTFSLGELVTFSRSGQDDGSWEYYEDLDGVGFTIPAGSTAIITGITMTEHERDDSGRLQEDIAVLVKGLQTSGWFYEAFEEYRSSRR